MRDELDVAAALAWAEARLAGAEDAAELVGTVLGRLLAYDAIHGGDLVRTVEVLIDCRWSSTEAARRLFLLRNSVLYRRSRIEDVGGLRLDDPGTRHLLELVLRLRRRLASARPPSPEEEPE